MSEIVMAGLFFIAAAVVIMVAGAIKAQGMTKEVPIVTMDDMIRKAADRFGVEFALVKAIVRKESNFDPQAVNPNDPSYGLMQITAAVAHDYGLVGNPEAITDSEKAQIFDPQTNLYIGTWHLSKLLGRYSFDIAIQMYNVGERGYNELGYTAKGYLALVKEYYYEYR